MFTDKHACTHANTWECTLTYSHTHTHARTHAHTVHSLTLCRPKTHSCWHLTEMLTSNRRRCVSWWIECVRTTRLVLPVVEFTQLAQVCWRLPKIMRFSNRIATQIIKGRWQRLSHVWSISILHSRAVCLYCF